jgi:hypothetical protein
MRWNVWSDIQPANFETSWEKWFAWYPIRLHRYFQEGVWFEWIKRRRNYLGEREYEDLTYDES